MSEEDNEFVSLDDLKISRDAEGNINPVTGETPAGNRIKIRPMPTGDNEKFFGELDDPTKADHETKAQVMKKYFIEPSFPDDWSGEDVRDNMDRASVNDLIVGLMLYSGYMRTATDDIEDGGIKNKL